MNYLIWSIEHDGWWKASEMGYTQYLGAAGVYSSKKAFEIVERANRHNEDDVNEALVPLTGIMYEKFKKALFTLEQKMDQDADTEGDSFIRTK